MFNLTTLFVLKPSDPKSVLARVNYPDREREPKQQRHWTNR